METLNNYGVVNSQRLIEEFEWQEKNFFSYLISFNEYNGFFKIVRQSNHEQALIGAQMIFAYSAEKGRITKYRILNYNKPKKNEKRRLAKRK